MGACSSKNEEPHRDGDTAPSRGLRKGRSKVTFNTDLRDKNETTKTFSEVLVRRNTQPVWEVYDLSQGVELGRGACGMVQVVKKISSGEARRLRLFRRSLPPAHRPLASPPARGLHRGSTPRRGTAGGDAALG